MAGRLLLALSLASGLAAASCSSDASADGSAASTPGSVIASEPESETETGAVVQGDSFAGEDAEPPSAVGGLDVLPEREGPRRVTTGSVPHQQIGAPRLPDVDAQLRERAFSLPGVGEAPSGVSLPGATALWLADDLAVAHPEAMNGREFAHIHPDGSLHVWLPVERANEVHAAKWGELHPWIGRDDFWDGVVMVFAPESLGEVDVVMRLLVDSYNFVVGAEVDSTDF